MAAIMFSSQQHLDPGKLSPVHQVFPSAPQKSRGQGWNAETQGGTKVGMNLRRGKQKQLGYNRAGVQERFRQGTGDSLVTGEFFTLRSNLQMPLKCQP
jgi:hypothetical protein